jgi:hypothetical protein
VFQASFSPRSVGEFSQFWVVHWQVKVRPVNWFAFSVLHARKNTHHFTFNVSQGNKQSGTFQIHLRGKGEDPALL